MSLLDEFKDSFVILTKTYVDDGLGGFTAKYVESEVTITGAMAFTASPQTMTAMAQGVTSVYSLVTDKSIVLEYHDVLKRVKDGKIFRVTSDGDDEFTPDSSPLNKRRVTCEEWTLPGGTE